MTTDKQTDNKYQINHTNHFKCLINFKIDTEYLQPAPIGGTIDGMGPIL
jgi:hypothetical protein